MPEFEKPDSPEDLLAGITVALLITAVISLPIVVGFLLLSIDAPTWSLGVAVAVIFLLSLGLAFGPEPDEEEDVQVEDNLRWTRLERPTDFKGWAKRVGNILLAWWGLGILVNVLILGVIFDASDTAKSIAAIALIPIAVLLETYDFVEMETDPSEDGDRYTSTTDEVARQTSE